MFVLCIVEDQRGREGGVGNKGAVFLANAMRCDLLTPSARVLSGVWIGTYHCELMDPVMPEVR